MKSAVLLFLVVMMLVKPLWPIAEYIINYDYIANVLCENKDKPQLQCDGKCYLAKKLAEESQDPQENPFQNSQKFESPKLLPHATEGSSEGHLPLEDPMMAPLGHHASLFSLLLVYDRAQPPEA